MSKQQNTENRRICLIQENTLNECFYCLDWWPLNIVSMYILKSLCPFENLLLNDPILRGVGGLERVVGKCSGEARGDKNQIVTEEAVEGIKRTSLGYLIWLLSNVTYLFLPNSHITKKLLSLPGQTLESILIWVLGCSIQQTQQLLSVFSY